MAPEASQAASSSVCSICNKERVAEDERYCDTCIENVQDRCDELGLTGKMGEFSVSSFKPCKYCNTEKKIPVMLVEQEPMCEICYYLWLIRQRRRQPDTRSIAARLRYYDQYIPPVQEEKPGEDESLEDDPEVPILDTTEESDDDSEQGTENEAESGYNPGDDEKGEGVHRRCPGNGQVLTSSRNYGRDGVAKVTPVPTDDFGFSLYELRQRPKVSSSPEKDKPQLRHTPNRPRGYYTKKVKPEKGKKTMVINTLEITIVRHATPSGGGIVCIACDLALKEPAKHTLMWARSAGTVCRRCTKLLTDAARIDYNPYI